jgi:hypothetical protein
MRYLAFVLVAWMLACGGSAAPATSPGQFTATGLKLVIGVDRTKTIEVKPDGSVVSSETGTPVMTFVGTELRSADGAKTILSLQGDDLRGPTSSLGTFNGDVLTLADLQLSVKDGGVVNVVRNGSKHKMRMHFDGSVAGRKRPALMLVAFVFALYMATNPTVTFDRFVD